MRQVTKVQVSLWAGPECVPRVNLLPRSCCAVGDITERASAGRWNGACCLWSGIAAEKEANQKGNIAIPKEAEIERVRRGSPDCVREEACGNYKLQVDLVNVAGEWVLFYAPCRYVPFVPKYRVPCNSRTSLSPVLSWRKWTTGNVNRLLMLVGPPAIHLVPRRSLAPASCGQYAAGIGVITTSPINILRSGSELSLGDTALIISDFGRLYRHSNGGSSPESGSGVVGWTLFSYSRMEQRPKTHTTGWAKTSKLVGLIHQTHRAIWNTL